MLTASDVEIELAASEGRVRSAADRGLVVPDSQPTIVSQSAVDARGRSQSTMSAFSGDLYRF